METTNFTITLGSRSYDISIPDDEFLAYLNDDLNELKTNDNSIEIPVFLNHYLKKSYAYYKLSKECENIKEQSKIIKEKLEIQENEIKNMLDKFKQG